MQTNEIILAVLLAGLLLFALVSAWRMGGEK